MDNKDNLRDQWDNMSPKPKEKSHSKPSNVNENGEQKNNPLHGVKLADILDQVVEKYGWEKIAKFTGVKIFYNNPTTKSGLKFLRKTRWARDKVELLYLKSLKSKK